MKTHPTQILARILFADFEPDLFLSQLISGKKSGSSGNLGIFLGIIPIDIDWNKKKTTELPQIHLFVRGSHVQKWFPASTAPYSIILWQHSWHSHRLSPCCFGSCTLHQAYPQHTIPQTQFRKRQSERGVCVCVCGWMWSSKYLFIQNKTKQKIRNQKNLKQ